MSASQIGSTEHMSDGELLALLDHEPLPSVSVARQHLDACDVCRTRLDALESSAARVSALLSVIPVPAVTEETFRQRLAARGRRTSPVWRRPAFQAAAVVIVGAAAAAAAATPLRQWIRQRVEAARVDRAASQPPMRASNPHVVDRAGTTVSFAPVGSVFTMRLDSVPSAGVVTVSRTNEAEITARVESGAGTGGDALVVLPGAVRVRNTTLARASYGISLPPTVTRFRLIIAERTVFDGPAPATISLRTPR